MLATGTVTDPLGASDTDTLTVSAGGATGVRTVATSFFANRVNWGNSITETQQGPESSPDPYNHIAGPWTLGFQMTMVADARSTGMRVMKMPAGHGAVTAACWNSAGVLQQSKDATWVADDGGWFTFEWDAPVELVEDEVYHFGYHYASTDSNWAASMYVWNNSQDTCVYPMLVLGSAGPSWLKAGGALTFTALTSDHTFHNYYIDPIVERDVDVPGYESGTDYYDQFPNGGSRFAFPCVIDFADAQWLDDYEALGMNTVIITEASDGNIAAVKATGLDWYPMLHDNLMSGPEAAMDDEVLAPQIRGYFLTDEPEFSSDTLPSTVRTWRNNARRLDSTRPIYLNLGRMVMENQGFSWRPSGISAKDVNLQWREYMTLCDIGSVDSYGLAHSFPFTYQGSSDTDRYGIWSYPPQVHRMRNEITDCRIPIWGELETTSAYASSPTPDEVVKATWSLLIAGAKGIIYFDHRFAGVAVTQDFAAMIHDAPMAAAVTALNAQMISLAGALNAPEAGYISDAAASGTLAAAQGGLPAGVKIPLHYSSRVVDIGEGVNRHYFFVQSIRDGDAGTVTFTIPGFEDAVLTVIGESRTETVSGAGVVTDTFTGDYDYHLYYTDTNPSFSAPAIVVGNDPAISDDGTPQTGETVTCSTGTWTGVPAPAFTYQWHRNVGGDIVGATAAAHVLVEADESTLLTCKVTATNSQGSSTVSSNEITPTAAGDSAYVTEVSGDSPTAWWRLGDLTEEIGGHDLTESVTDVSAATGLITDTDGAQAWDGSGTACLSTADHADLRLSSSFTLEAWINPPSGDFRIITKTGDYRLGIHTGHFEFSPEGAGGYVDTCASTTTIVNGTTYHVVCTWDATTKIAKMYVNGALETTYDQTGHGFVATSSGWGDLKLGSTAGIGGTGFANGTLDEVAVYHTVLDATQVAAHYAAGTA